MWKLVLADDEPKIRRGIEGLIKWSDYDIEIVGEAEDGEIALEVIKNTNPDIILLDINMPFLNGLELIEKVHEFNEDVIVIIISGYDDFYYAQKALKLSVFDYILKPIKKMDLDEIILKATNELKKRGKQKDYLHWTSRHFDRNMDYFKETFFSQWLSNKLTDEEVIKELNFFGINFSENIGIIIIKVVDKFGSNMVDKKWDKQLLDFAIQNIANEDFKCSNTKFITMDDNKNVVIVMDINLIPEWIKYGRELQNKIDSYLKFHVIIEQRNVSDGILDVKNVYKNMIENIEKKSKYSKLVLLTIKYIDSKYYLNHLSVNDVSKAFEVSPSYLSKLLKKETGFSLIDYITNTRIKKAMCIMEDPTIKIYDVAELVGYSNQHYFCRAFKKIVGISPTEYQRR